MPSGAGAPDANGVYLYGEDDLVATTFSDFLNVALTSVSAQIAADRVRLGNLEALTTAWTTWTVSAALANVALGTGGTAFFRWRMRAGEVEVQGKVVFGSGAPSWTASPHFELPAAPLSTIYGTFSLLGSGTVFDTSAGTFFEVSVKWTGTGGTGKTANIYTQSGTPLSFSLIGGAAPFTPAAGDNMTFKIEYSAT